MRGKPESVAEHIAVRHEAALRTAFAQALGQTLAAHLTLSRLTDGLATNRSFQLTQSQPWTDFTNDLYARLQAILGGVFVASANASTVAKAEHALTIRFDLTNPEAIAYAQRYAAELVLDLSTTSQAALRAIITRMMQGELTPDSAARLIRASIGLTPRQVVALENFRAEMVRLGHAPDYIERKVEEYGRRKLAERATTIARTEAMRAANAGQTAAWQAAADQGILPRGGVQRRWITAADELVCPICQPLDGQLAPLDEPFPGGYEPADVHPNCRCSQILVYANDDGTFTTRPPRPRPDTPRPPSRSLRPRLRAI